MESRRKKEICQEQHVSETDIKNSWKSSEEALANNLIIKHILRYLRKLDLLETSFVSQYWNFWSREVLREKYCLTAKLQAFDRPKDLIKLSDVCPAYGSKINVQTDISPCEALQQFNTFLENSVNIPFNGLSIYFVKRKHHKCVPADSPSQRTCNIRTKIKMRFLDIGWDPESNCYMASKCVHEIIKSTAPSLEGLRIRHFRVQDGNTDGSCSTLAKFLNLAANTKTAWLSSIRRLDLRCSFAVGLAHVIRELVQGAPNLKELVGPIPSVGSKIIVEQDLTRFVEDYEYSPKRLEIEDGLLFAERFRQLKKLTVSTVLPPCSQEITEWSPALLSKVKLTLELLLQSNVTTLRELRMSYLELIWLTEHCNFPELSGLLSLTLLCSADDDKLHFDWLRKINWGEYFPKLRKISFASLDQHSKEMAYFYVKLDFLRKPSQFTCKTVTTLRICSDEIHGEIETFPTLFPNVNKLCFDYSAIYQSFLLNTPSDWWSAWKDLEFLRMSLTNLSHTTSIYGSSILGISLDEAYYLEDNIPNYNSLEIVSSSPGLSNLKKLRTLSLKFVHDYDCSEDPPNITIFAPLVLNLEFKRLNKLNVEIEIAGYDHNFCSQLGHLKTFVKFVRY